MSMQKNMDWLRRRGISDEIIKQSGIYTGEHPFMGECFVIPVGTFNKYRRNPFDKRTPKYLYDAGSKITLYGKEQLEHTNDILITEGELDSLVARSLAIPAVSSTGGCMSFQEEWVEWFNKKNVTICFDNDNAGAKGVVRMLKFFPRAKVALIPTFPNVKDITDYVMRGGNLHELLQNAIHRENIREDMEKRKAQWQDYYFHEKFLEEQETVRHSFVPIQNDEDRTDIENARVYPISNLLKFIHNKTRCIWHEEKTASLTYYPKTNTVYCFGCGKHGDAIDVYRTQTGRSFLEALDNLH